MNENLAGVDEQRTFGDVYRIEITEDVLAHIRQTTWMLGDDCVLCKAFRNAVACAELVPDADLERGFTVG